MNLKRRFNPSTLATAALMLTGIDMSGGMVGADTRDQIYFPNDRVNYEIFIEFAVRNEGEVYEEKRWLSGSEARAVYQQIIECEAIRSFSFNRCPGTGTKGIGGLDTLLRKWNKKYRS